MDTRPGLILAVDTSLPQLSAALISGHTPLGAVSLEGKESRNQKLLPAIDWLLRESGTSTGEIDLYCVTRGPGSFTGVRIGLATVQGMALATKRPICAMSTHEAAAEAADELDVLVYGDAGRGEWYASLFRDGEERMPPTLLDTAALQAIRDTEKVREIDVAAISAKFNLALLAASRTRRIQSAGELGRYADTSPLYVRLAEAEVKLAQRNHE